MVAIAPTLIVVPLPKEYSIDRSESEMTGPYSNSRAPGDTCCLQYQKKKYKIQIMLFCLANVLCRLEI